MSLVELLKRLTTSKPKLEYPTPIEGTDLIEGSRDGNIVIYDSKTNKVLFGGANPNLWYSGRLNGLHIASKQEQIDGNWKTCFVDEQGNILFGRKYDSELLGLYDSNSDRYVNINLHDLNPGLLKDRLEGTEDTLMEFVENGFDGGILNFYDKSGRVLARDIPAFIKEEKEEKWFPKEISKIKCSATRLCFVNVDGQLFLNIKYGQKFKVYELNRIQKTPKPYT